MRRWNTVVAAVVAALMLGLLGAIPAEAVGVHSVTARLTTPGGTALSGVAVTLTGTSDYRATATTDSAGAATFVEVPEGSSAISGSVQVIGGADRLVARALLVPDDGSVTVEVPGTRVITGTVTDAASKAGIAKARVYLNGYDDFDTWGESQWADADAVADAGGAYRAVVAAGHELYVWAWTKPYEMSRAWPRAGQTSTDLIGVDAVLSKPGIISGKVTYRGKPVSRVPVTLPIRGAVPGEDENGDYRAVTDASGRFSVVVSPGTYVAVADGGPKFLPTAFGGTVRFREGKPIPVTSGARLSADIKLVAAATVSGKVLNRQGKPVAKVWVDADNNDRAGDSSAVRTNKHGAYTLGGLATGKVTLHVAYADGRRAVTRTISVRQGRTTKVRPLVVPGASITGRVSPRIVTEAFYPDNSGKLVGGLVLLNTQHQVVARTNVSRSGRATFVGLAGGTYRVVVSGTNISRRVVVKQSGKASFGTLRGPKLTRVKGVVRYASGKVAAGYKVVVRDRFGTYSGHDRTDSKGRYSVVGVAGGTYSVLVHGTSGSILRWPWTENWAGQATVKVVAGKSKTGADVVVRRAATLHGVVRDSGGKPLSDVRVTVPDALDDPHTTDPRCDGTSCATTDSEGRWRLTVGAGRRTVSFADGYVGGYRFATRTVAAKSGTSTNVPARLR